jgi:hypothetical protein
MGLLSALGLTRPASWNTTPKTLPIWTEAKDTVGAQLSKLQSVLRNTGNPVAIEIADKGLHALTKRLQVGLQAALIGFDSATAEDRPAAAAKLRAATAGMKQFLATDAALPNLEANPFGVMVTIRSSLETALTAVERAASTVH